jgi:hypothetical protein
MKVTPNFKENKFKRLLCSNCQGFLTELSLEETKTRLTTCKKCKTKYIIQPPQKDTFDGVKVIKYGPGQETFTADLTEE